MTQSDTNGTLLVPIANVETAERLLDTATDIAADRSYAISIVHVVEVPPSIPLSEGGRLVDADDEALLDRAEALGTADVPIETRTRFARDIATGIVGAVDEGNVQCVLMGWRGRPPRRDIVLGSYIDTVLRDASCDVLVKRIRTPQPEVDSILVPVASGSHSEFAAETAGSIARRHDATIQLIHVLSEDASTSDRDAGADLLRRAVSALGNVRSVEQELVESGHVAGTLTDRSSENDLTVVGATERNLLRRKLLGTVSDAVGRNAAGTVLIARRQLTTMSRFRRLLR